MEQWKEIKGFKNYFISSSGNGKTRTGKIVKTKTITMYDEQKRKNIRRLSQLRLEYFGYRIPSGYKRWGKTDYAVSIFGLVWNIRLNKATGLTTTASGRQNISLNRKDKLWIDHAVINLFAEETREGVKIEHIDGDMRNSNICNLRAVYKKPKEKKEPVYYDPEALEGEEYRPIEGFKHYYVSNLGNVWSAKSGRRLVLRVTDRGYLDVGMTNRGKNFRPSVHRLVAQAFIANNSNKPQVNHMDKNKTNNAVTNLEWVTDQENKDHAHGVVNYVSV